MQRRYIGNSARDNSLFSYTHRASHKVNSYSNRRRGGFRL